MALAEVPHVGPNTMNWLHALKALRRLLRNKDDTVQVFEIMRALNGRTPARNYQRLLRSKRGGRIAYERVEFAQRLMDDAWLDSLPAGSVGAAYRDFIRSEQLSAHGLVKISQEGFEPFEIAHPHAWMGRRTRDVHDIWHILTGYGRDSLGEACLVAFSYPQTRGLGWLLIALGAAFRSRRGPNQPYGQAILEGYLRGRRTPWLLGEDYEALMAEPLDAARERMGLVMPPRIYESVPAPLRDRVLAGI